MSKQLLKRIFGNSLAPDWTFSPGAIIWKLQPTSGGILFGESRDVDRRTLELFAVRASDGQVLIQGMKLKEPWWIALEMIIGELAVMHSYPKPDMPNAVGTTIIDCRTGKVLWEDPTIRILCGTEEIALAQRGHSLDVQDLVLLDARTGLMLEEIGGNLDRAAEFQAVCEAVPMPGGWMNSTPVTSDDDRFDEISQLIGQAITDQRGLAEVADFGNFTVVSVHARSRASAQAMLAGHVDNHLLLYRQGRLQYREIIHTGTSGPGEDTFFVWNGMLIFIREGRTLAAINLTKDI